MKKRRLRLLLAAVIGTVVLVIVAAIYLGERPPVRFRFLDGYEASTRRPWPNTEAWSYRIEGDYNDVYTDAAVELAALGFGETSLEAFDDPESGYQRHVFFRHLTLTYGVMVFIGEPDNRASVDVGVARWRIGPLDHLRFLIFRVKRRFPPTSSLPSP
jgi:hypothetical protein